MRGFVLTCYYTLFGVIWISFWVVNTLLDNSHIDLLKLRYHNICMTLKLNAFPSPIHMEEHLHGQCWNELEEEIIRKVTSRLLIFITTLVQGVSNFMWEGFVFLLCQFCTEYCYFQHRNHLVSRVPSYDPVSEVEDMGAISISDVCKNSSFTKLKLELHRRR